MNTPYQQYRRQIGRCFRLVNVLSEENLKEVNSVLSDYLEEFHNIKNRMIDGGNNDLNVEIFDLYVRTLCSLLEYSDNFILCDIDRYKQSLLYLLSNFRTIAKGDIRIHT